MKDKWIVEQLEKTNSLLESIISKNDTIIFILKKILVQKIREDKKDGIQ